MADLVITAANVVAGSGATVDKHWNAGEAVVQGAPVYFDATVNQWKNADANGASAASRSAGGIALNATAGAGQPLAVLKKGAIVIGAAVVAGSRYYLSPNVGKIMPEADLTTGDDVCLIGLAVDAATLAVDIQTPGVTLS